MKTTSIREFRNRVAELIDSDEPVLVTRHGRNAAVLYPLGDPKKIPIEVRRRLFKDITESIREQLDAAGVTDEEVSSELRSSKKRRRR